MLIKPGLESKRDTQSESRTKGLDGETKKESKINKDSDKQKKDERRGEKKNIKEK